MRPEDLAAIQRTIAEAFAKAGGGSYGSPVNIHLPASLDLKIPPPEVTVNLPEQAPAQISVTVPEQPAPQVTVNVPEPKVLAPAKASGPQEVIVVAMPDRAHKAIRDKSGKVTGSVETDAQ